MTCRLAVAFLALAASGCAGSTATFPSLAPRAVERQGFDEPTVVATTTQADPALDARLATLDQKLRGIAADFASAAADAERKALLARGRAAGSDQWLDAQTALATLDDWRAQASGLATDVEQLAIARAATLAAAYPALTALGDRADGEADRQSRTIARIQTMLAPA